MKSWLMCILLLINSIALAAQTKGKPVKIIPVADFSGKYRADVTLSHDEDQQQQAVLRVYRKDGNQTVIEQETATDHYDDKVVLTLGSAGQGVLLYEDFNFDGIKDFAIMDNNQACYNAPSYTVFVDTGSGFQQDDELSQVSKNYCGFFYDKSDVNTIRMVNQLGCCEHRLEIYRLTDKPQQLRLQKQDIITLDNSHFYEHWLRTTFDNQGNTITRQTKAKLIALERDDFKPLLSFDIQDNGHKTVYVFALANGQIDVASTFYQSTDVSLSLRMSKIHGVLDTITPAVLYWDAATSSLCMVHNNVQYAVVDDGQKIGVKITDQTGTRFVPALGNSQGQLKNILKTPMSNVKTGSCA